jgi:hypothetical protein
MASTQLETLERSLDLPGMRRFEKVTFALLFVAAAVLIFAIVATHDESLLSTGGAILGGAVIIGGGALALSFGSTALARRHIERLLASIPDGPSRVEYFELLGREASARAIELEVEVGEAQGGQHRAIEHAIHEQFPGVVTSWNANTLIARSPGYACTVELDLDDEGRVTVHDNGPLHAFFVGVLECTGRAKRVRVREVKPEGALAGKRRSSRKRR